MVPTYAEVMTLWKKFDLPPKKQKHCLLVAKLALFFASKMQEKNQIIVRRDVLLAAALLHDIDNNISHEEGETHPDTAVRVLRECGMNEVANIVKTHPLHSILDNSIAPKSWEEKILFLADKMVKNDIMTVEERFSLWRQEQLPPKEQELLLRAFPKVKELEHSLCTAIGLTPTEVIQFAKQSILGNKGELL